MADPGKGSLTLTGAAPKRGTGLRVAGEAPSISTTGDHTIGVPKGSLTLATLTPAVAVNSIATPSVINVTVTGETPTLDITDNHVRAPPTAEINLTGHVVYDYGGPGFKLIGRQPTLDITLFQFETSPDPASANLSGQVPTIAVSENVFAAPATGTLSLTGELSYLYGGPGFQLIGYQPSAVIQVSTPTVIMPKGSMNLSGAAPTVDIVDNSWIANPDVNTLSFTTHAPASTIFIANLDASLQLTGYIPTFSFDTLVGKTPGTGNLNLTGLTPVVDLELTQKEPNVGTLTINTDAPTVGRGVLPAKGTLALTGSAPSYNFGFFWVAYPGVENLSLAGQTPTIEVGPRKAPGAGVLDISGNIPTVAYDWTVTPGTAALNADRYNPFVGEVPTPDPGGLSLTGLSLTVDLPGVETTPNTSPLNLIGNTPELRQGGTFTDEPGAGALTLNTHVPRLLGDGTTGGGSGGKRSHGAVILPRLDVPEDFGYTDEELIAIAFAIIQEFYY